MIPAHNPQNAAIENPSIAKKIGVIAANTYSIAIGINFFKFGYGSDSLFFQGFLTSISNGI